MEDYLYYLRLQLEGRIPEEEVRHQMDLYSSYIEENLAGGEPLESILRRLGDPQDLSEMIIKAWHNSRESLSDIIRRENPFNDRTGYFDEDPEETARAYEGMTEEEIEINSRLRNPAHGIKAEFSEEKGWNVHLGKVKLNGLWGTVLIVVIVAAIFTVIRQLG